MIGSGTVLDTARLKERLGEHLEEIVEVFMRLLLENMETVRLPLGQVPTCQVFHSMISAR